MNQAAHFIGRPIKTSIVLSILLHGAIFVVFLQTYESTRVASHHLQIELVDSVAKVSNSVPSKAASTVTRKNQVTKTKAPAIISKPFETLASIKSNSQQELLNSNIDVKKEKKAAADEKTSSTDATLIDASDTKSIAINARPNKTDLNNSLTNPDSASRTLESKESIIALLHKSISEKQDYPYIARRQRREGVARIGFTLYPDGTIENTRLVQSSSMNSLDRAALSAVKRIAPFKPAQHYLEQAETFNVDVVFSLI